MLEILHRCENFIAVNKPHGLLVHRTALASGAASEENAMALARDQIGQWVYPVHRLDRATSGALVFALSSEAAEALSRLFREKMVQKTYYAVVRGHTAPEGAIDKPMRKNFLDRASPFVEARTEFKRLDVAELPFAVGKYSTARYSLLEVRTRTGRLHQIRRHMTSLSHPLVVDSVHGDGRHNRLFREKIGINRLLLHAIQVTFDDPFSKRQISIQAGSLKEFLQPLCVMFPEWSRDSK